MRPGCQSAEVVRERRPFGDEARVVGRFAAAHASDLCLDPERGPGSRMARSLLRGHADHLQATDAAGVSTETLRCYERA